MRALRQIVCRGLIATCALLGARLVAATPIGPKFGPLFRDHAVVQCDRPVAIWGAAAPGQEVVVRLLEQEVKATADAEGRWRATLGPYSPGRAGDLILTAAGTKVVVHDVMTGEVWICAGQSNMQFPLRMARDGLREAAAVDNPGLRAFKVGIQVSSSPADDVDGRWANCTPATAGEISAVAYYFGREIAARTGRPVGLIVTAKGGSPVESWLSPDVLRSHPAVPVLLQRWTAALARTKAAPPRPGLPPIEPGETSMVAVGPGGYAAPGVLFNGMMHPLCPYTLRGMIWYQGEANTSRTFATGPEYALWFKAMLTDWRVQWGYEFPFYWVQLPANSVPGRDVNGEMWASLRDAQAAALALPHTGMAMTIDLGEPDVMHPTWKQPVGHRLALLAEKRAYAMSVVDHGPDDADAVHVGDGIRVRFGAVAGALATRDGEPPKGFELCGLDEKYRPAVARLEHNEVVVSAPGMSPVGVRYAWNRDPGLANLTDGSGLPGAPFRFDSISAVAFAERDAAARAWEGVVPENLRQVAGFSPVIDMPGLPRVLLIGDSISIGYTAAVQERLNGRANVHRVPRNAENTTLSLGYLDQWLGTGHWDVIHCNWGLHDLTSKGPKPAGYAANLAILFGKLRATGAKVIFATTTPIPPDSIGRKPGLEIPYNAAARQVLAANPDIGLDDLYAFALARLKDIQKPRDVHFTEYGSEVLGYQVAETIAAQLPMNRDVSRPAPPNP